MLLAGGPWEERIIPARAGFTRPRVHLGGAGADHPRSRGVYVQRATGKPVMLGSSPLARGLRGDHARRVHRRRIIPARAGFTRSAGRRRGSRRDHPRSRGVYRSYTRTTQTDSGSSPLARGLRPGRGWRVRATGIIPARAGFTRRVEDVVLRGRIIPARAGFTGHGRLPGRPRRDHPRSRGVYCVRRWGRT